MQILKNINKLATALAILLLITTMLMANFQVKAQDEEQPHGGTPGPSAFP